MSYYDLSSTEGIMEMADIEAGPCCEEAEYQRLRGLMIVAPALLEALEKLHDSLSALNDSGDAGRMVANDVEIARAAIALAKGESQCSQK